MGRKEPNVIIIGVDYHLRHPYIAFVNTETCAATGNWTTARARPSVIGNWRHKERACAWGCTHLTLPLVGPSAAAGSDGCRTKRNI